MKYKYGEFSDTQISQTKINIRKSIFFLLLCVDPGKKYKFQDIDVNKAFEGLLYKLGGMNDVLYEPPELVDVISLLKAAQFEYNSENFNFKTYRKDILDAGAAVLKIKEDDYYA